MTAATTATKSSVSRTTADRVSYLTAQVEKEYGVVPLETLGLVWAARGKPEVSIIDCDALTEYLWWKGVLRMASNKGSTITLVLANWKEGDNASTRK